MASRGRILRAAALALVGVCAFVCAPNAHAFDQKTDDAAKKIDVEVMDVDFLSLDFKKAKKKLQDALKKCGKDKCGKPTVALLHRDLGIVQINAKDKKGGGKELAAALANDPNVTVGKDYLDNPDVKSAWESAKKSAGVSDGGETTGGGDGGGTTGGESGGEGGETGADIPTADGNLVVKTKVAPTNSELPILIEVPKGSEIKKVKLSYKSPSMAKYKAVEAKKIKSRWLVVLPCGTANKTGILKYFVRAYDADDQEVEHYGTTKKPAQIKIAENVADEAKPLMPGDEEPKSCEGGESSEGGGGDDGEDKKKEGDGCEEDDECATGLACVENVESGKKACKATEESKEATANGDAPKWFVGVDAQVDFLFISAEHDICAAPSWACSVDSSPNPIRSGRQDVGVSDPNAGIVLRTPPSTAGKTDGGTSRGTTRLLVSVDRFLSPSFSVGARAGYLLGGNPTTNFSGGKFVPFQFEVRAQYFFVKSGTVRPFGLAGGGYGMTEAPVPGVIVTPNDPADADDPTSGTLSNVTAWKLGGPWFAEVGAGMWVMISDRVALDIAPKLLFPAPTFVLTGSLEIGMKFGF